MKDTIKNIKKYTCCMAKDATNTFIDFVTVLCSLIFLLLQLIATPFKWLAFVQEREHARFDVDIDEIDLDDIDIDEALEELFDSEEPTVS